MTVRYSPALYKKLKKLDIRIYKQFKHSIELFIKNPDDPLLHNHPLKREWEGFRSIDVTADYRAIYEELHEGEKVVAYFVNVDTHEGLYG